MLEYARILVVLAAPLILFVMDTALIHEFYWRIERPQWPLDPLIIGGKFYLHRFEFNKADQPPLGWYYSSTFGNGFVPAPNENPWCDKLVAVTEVEFVIEPALAHHINQHSPCDPMKLIASTRNNNPTIEQAMVKMRLLAGAPEHVCQAYRRNWADMLNLTNAHDNRPSWFGQTLTSHYSTLVSVQLDHKNYEDNRNVYSIEQRIWIEMKILEGEIDGIRNL